MGVRPPQGNTETPEIIEFGIAAVNARLDDADVTFPATKGEVLRALDDTEVPYDASGNTLDLAEAFGRLHTERFDSETELLELLHPVFEERRATGAGDVVGRLRSLLPF